MNKQRSLLYIPLFIYSILLIGCSLTYDFASAGKIITVTTSSGGSDEYRNLISKNITVYADGTVILANDEDPENNAPIFITKIKKAQIDQIKNLLEEE